MQRLVPSRTGPRHNNGTRGFTLIETMIAVGIVGVLSSIAYPSLEGHVLRARRTDGMVALMQAQLAQERYRANNRTYGELTDIGLRSTSMSGYYTLQVTSSSTDGYEVVATATGRQARDGSCQTLRLAAYGASLGYASGVNASASNPPDVNLKCWNQR